MDNLLQASLIPGLCGSYMAHRSTSPSKRNKKHDSIGGYFNDGKFCWLAQGSLLTIICHATSKIVSCKNFKQVFQDDSNLTIVSCKTFGDLLIIGLNSDSGKGLACVFNHNICKVIKSIRIPNSITCMEVILEEGGATQTSKPFAPNLRWFFGVVAIGTANGHLYLVDMRLDDSNLLADVKAAAISVVPTVIRDIPQVRDGVHSRDAHLAFDLLDQCHEDVEFHFVSPDYQILATFLASEVAVTSLCFERRCTSLFVGLSFGQFHIFDLKELVLSFSSRIRDVSGSVTNFVFQEPENDPKNFCYLWIVQSVCDQALNETASRGTMYQLIFAKKELLKAGKSLKSLYGELESCNPSFQIGFDETLGIGSSPGCCQVLQCSAIERYHPLCRSGNEDDYSSTPYISVFLTTWLTTKDNVQTVHMLLFDINSWYVAHMPSAYRGFSEDEIYVALWSLNAVLNDSDDDVLAVCSSPSSLHHFCSKGHPTPRQFTYPSSYTLRTHCLTTSRTLTCKLSSVQDQAIDYLLEARSEPLVNPDIIFTQMMAVGLVEHCMGDVLTIDQKREAILSSALNHDIFAYLSRVIADLSTGEHAASGCSLRFVLEWAWKQTALVKESIDSLCIPIFDCTVVTLDSTSQKLLCRHITQLNNLRLTFKKLKQAEVSSQRSLLELEVKDDVICLILDYLKILRWFIGARVLPEQLDEHLSFELESYEEFHYVYKQKELRANYEERRKEIKDINRSSQSSLLIIDGLLDEAGKDLITQWRKTDDHTPAKYPPPSLYALLSMYYLDSIDERLKHTITTYFLLDILAFAEAANENGRNSEVYEATYNEHRQTVSYFPQTFQLPPSQTKLIKAFWLLDHQQFQESCWTFCEAGTERVTSAWQHQRILQAYMMQGQHNYALQYLVTQQPATTCVEDVKVHIDVLVKNRKLHHALNTAQMKTDVRNKEAIYTHLFSSCYKHDALHGLLKLISKEEENLVNKYLETSNIPYAHDILVLHLLHRSRHVDAIKLYKSRKKPNIMAKHDEVEKGYHSTLKHIIQGYINYLPKPLKDCALVANEPLRRNPMVRKEAPRIQPLSATLNSTKKTAPLSLAALMSLNVGRIRDPDPVPPPTPFKHRSDRHLTSNLDSSLNSSMRYFTTDLQMDGNARKSSRRSLTRNSFLNTSFGGAAESPTANRRRAALASTPTIPAIPLEDIAKKKSALMTFASVMLQTPPIKRNVKKTGKNGSCLDINTPQSILKVKAFRMKDLASSDAISATSSQTATPRSVNSASLKEGPSSGKHVFSDRGLDSSGSECEIPGWMMPSMPSSLRKKTPKTLNTTFNIDTPPVKEILRKSKTSVAEESNILEQSSSTKRLRFQDLSSESSEDEAVTKLSFNLPSLSNVVVRATDEDVDVDIEGDVTDDVIFVEPPSSVLVEEKNETSSHDGCYVTTTSLLPKSASRGDVGLPSMPDSSEEVALPESSDTGFETRPSTSDHIVLHLSDSSDHFDEEDDAQSSEEHASIDDDEAAVEISDDDDDDDDVVSDVNVNDVKSSAANLVPSQGRSFLDLEEEKRKRDDGVIDVRAPSISSEFERESQSVTLKVNSAESSDICSFERRLSENKASNSEQHQNELQRDRKSEALYSSDDTGKNLLEHKLKSDSKEVDAIHEDIEEEVEDQQTSPKEEETPVAVPDEEVPPEVTADDNRTPQDEYAEENNSSNSPFPSAAAVQQTTMKPASPPKQEVSVEKNNLYIVKSTPNHERLREEPSFFLSPPLTRSGRKRTQRTTTPLSTRTTPSRKLKPTKPLPSPTFIFSPPSTVRTRSQRKRKTSAGNDVDKPKTPRFDSPPPSKPATSSTTPSRSSKRLTAKRSASETALKKSTNEKEKVVKSKSVETILHKSGKKEKHKSEDTSVNDAQPSVTRTSSRRRTKKLTTPARVKARDASSNEDTGSAGPHLPHTPMPSSGPTTRLQTATPMTATRSSSRLKAKAMSHDALAAVPEVTSSAATPARRTRSASNEQPTVKNTSSRRQKRAKADDVEDAVDVVTTSGRKPSSNPAEDPVVASTRLRSRSSTRSRDRQASTHELDDIVEESEWHEASSVRHKSIYTEKKKDSSKPVWSPSSVGVKLVEATSSGTFQEDHLNVVSRSTRSGKVIFPITSRRKAKVRLLEKKERKYKQ